MHIKELILNSFGMFRDRQISLDDGLNVIYGMNEAGKSTVHSFIEGMFYGFFKQNVRRKMYSEEYDRYFPWSAGKFNGAMVISADNKEYRIERDLGRGTDAVRIYENLTGRDITESAPKDSVTGLPDPAAMFLGLSRNMYRNTLSVSQLELKTDRQIAGEVREIFVNLHSGRSSDISVAKAVASLKEKQAALGTVKAGKSEIGTLSKMLVNLDTELSESMKRAEEARTAQLRLNLQSSEADALRREMSSIISDISAFKTIEAKTRYTSAIEIISRKESLENQENSLSEQKFADEADYEAALKQSGIIDELEKSIKEINEKVKIIADEKSQFELLLSAYGIYSESDKVTPREIFVQYSSLKELEKQTDEVSASIRNTIKEINEGNALPESISEDYSRYNENIKAKTALEDKPERQIKKAKAYISAGIAAFTAAVLSVLAGMFISDIIYIAAAVFAFSALLLAFIYILSFKRSKAIIAQLKLLDVEICGIHEKYKTENDTDFRIKYAKKLAFDEKKEALFAEECRLREKLDTLKNEICVKLDILVIFLDRYVPEVNREISDENLNSAAQRCTEHIKLLEKSELADMEFKRLSEEIDQKAESLKKEKEMLGEIFSRNNVSDIACFREAVTALRNLREIRIRLQDTQKQLDDVLAGKTIEILREAAAGEDSLPSIRCKSLHDAESALDDCRARLERIADEQARTEERMRAAEAGGRAQADILSEKDELLLKKQNAEMLHRAYGEAINTIEMLSARLRDNFAPVLNAVASGIIKRITDGKYDSVMLDSEMNIRITDKAGGRVADISELSAGTIDQLYFAVRFAVLDLTGQGGKLPLLLDDCFVNYDMKRLSGVMKFLGNEAVDSDRQILLFTCHEREKQILDTNLLPYRHVELG